MEINEQLKGNYSNIIRKDKEIFSAMITNTSKTGAIESVLNDAKDFGDFYCRNPDIYNQEGDILEKTISFISFLERFSGETDDGIKSRMKAIFQRKGDTVWGTPSNVKNVFESYYPSAEIIVIENTNSIDENLIVNGDFEESSGWNISDESIRCAEARYARSVGIKLQSESDYVKQVVELDTDDTNYTVRTNDTYSSIAKMFYGNSNQARYISSYSDNPNNLIVGETIKIPSRNMYFLHFFLSGNCNVIIKDTSNNKYWDDSEKKWGNSVIKNYFESTESLWDPQSLWILNDYSVNSIEITFEGVDESYLDYIRLFQKKEYSSFTVIAHIVTSEVGDVLALGTGTIDEGPIVNLPDGSTNPPKYGNFGYYDNSYLTGESAGFSQEINNDLLSYIKTVGIRAYFEIIRKDED